MDSRGRRVRDLRLSLTTRCNYQCVYCRPTTSAERPVDLLASDCLRAAAIFQQLGVRKIRLTGGEPLLRADIIEVVRRLALLRANAPLELAVTTNGHFLAELANDLQAAGLDRVNVSLDTLAPEGFSTITRNNELSRVLTGIRLARHAGLNPVKINCVVLRNVNDDQIIPLVEFARAEGVVVRFWNLCRSSQ